MDKNNIKIINGYPMVTLRDYYEVDDIDSIDETTISDAIDELNNLNKRLRRKEGFYVCLKNLNDSIKCKIVWSSFVPKGEKSLLENEIDNEYFVILYGKK